MSEKDLKAALVRLYERDCPMAMPDLRDRSIDVGVRRWRAFDGGAPAERGDRVEAMARELWRTFESRPAPGPELQDYRRVAEAIAALLDPVAVGAG